MDSKAYSEKKRLARLAKLEARKPQTKVEAYNTSSRMKAKHNKMLALSADTSSESRKEQRRISKIWLGNKVLKPTGYYNRDKARNANGITAQ